MAPQPNWRRSSLKPLPWPTDLLSGNDRPVSSQRLDEIAIRLARLDATQTATNAEVAALVEQQLIRKRQRDRETRIELRAGTAGTVWRVFNAPGDRIAANSTVANVIDCSRSDVTAIFSQRDVGGLAPRPAGRRPRRRFQRAAQRRGCRCQRLLRQRHPDRGGRNHARDRQGIVLVRIHLDFAVPACLVGLHATVRLE